MCDKDCEQCKDRFHVGVKIDGVLLNVKEPKKDLKCIETEIQTKYNDACANMDLSEIKRFRSYCELLNKIKNTLNDLDIHGDRAKEVLSEDELKTLIDSFKELSDYDKRFESVVNYLSEINK